MAYRGWGNNEDDFVFTYSIRRPQNCPNLYHVILKPEFFPLDTDIFIGRISHERMLEEHPLEYERVMSEEKT